MAKTTYLNMRVHPETKEAAEALFANFGLSAAEAVSIFLHQSILLGGFPFDFRPFQLIVDDEADDDDFDEEDGEVINLDAPKHAALRKKFQDMGFIKPE